MTMPTGVLVTLALMISAGGMVSNQPSEAELETIKKSRDANEYFAKRHKYYDRVDLSFSRFPIDTELPEVKDRLTDLSCDEYDGCEAKDADGNRLYFWGAYWEKDGQRGIDHILTIKTVRAEEFKGRFVSALGVGSARKKADVLNNVKKFLPGLEIDCDRKPPGNVGTECLGNVDPGWFRIIFDEQGNLLNLRFDAYHFT